MELSVAGQLYILAVVAICTIVYVRRSRRAAPSACVPQPPKAGMTFRVRGVPLEWDNVLLCSFLADQDRSASLRVLSLATEVNGQSKTATVSFQNPSASQSWQLHLPEESPRPQCITLDDGFLGLTTLYIPSPEDHKIDVIAVSGLGGHAFGSFKERGGVHMWLRDALPYDLTHENDDRPMGRAMTFGNDTAVAESTSTQNLEDLASSFHSSLLPLVAGPRTRPIIFVAHSLGGLIVKQALISLAKSEKDEDKMLLQAVYGVAFFGVPHDGMDISSLIPMVGNRPNRFLLESISRVNSQVLSTQQREFQRALGREGAAEVFSFYETSLSPTATKAETGEWEMKGPLAVLVTKSSATHCRPWEDGTEHMCAIDRTHSDMVKFGQHDNEYDKARGRLIGLARRAVTRRRRGPGTHFVVPYVENRHFVGRSETLAQLKRQLGLGQRPGDSPARLRVSLHGLGGVGKTQVALAYVFWLCTTCPEISVFWVHASSAERFHQSFFDIAQKCEIPGRDDPKMDVLLLVKNWLGDQNRRRWLMVIDNADDTELFFNKSDTTPNANVENLASYLPESDQGSLLITTRNKQTGIKLTMGKTPIVKDRMEDGDCRTLLQTRLEGNAATDHDLSTLAKRLEYLPLALVQAAAFIQENSITVQEYFELQDDSDQGLVDLLSEEFETVGRDSGAPRAVAQTWMISFQRIERNNTLAGQLLSFMCLLDRQDIPKEFLSHYSNQEQSGGPSSRIQFEKALGALKAFSFIGEENSGRYDMHRLVQLVTRKWLTSRGTISRFGREVLMTISHLFPFGEFETRSVCAAYLSHAYGIVRLGEFETEDEAKAKASLLHCMAGYLNFEGRWAEAELLFVQVMETTRRVLGVEHPSTLSSMNNLAHTWRGIGKIPEALDLMRTCISLGRVKLGPDHPYIQSSISALGLWESDSQDG
ncbi:Protein SERAC1 [Tolypocladium ophioglossoides CBS 100239]|uniref:Protein SERAC1 n=1 Tax=Tolypocladium ophioglossoides (strain CBS 100239) TaxID=1163406 RepID=A0A0L0N5B1_TOLOC|nr:Protein SERAC1 [Tolypocladium ophioglossoides CBS 100239]